jgi:hypothetical protein
MPEQDKNKDLFFSKDIKKFSFKYSVWKVLWRVGTICLSICFSLIVVYGKPNDPNSLCSLMFDQIFGGLLLQMFVFSLLDTILTKEIILYPGKITKTWWFGLRRDVVFASSKFGSMKTAFFSTKRFYPSCYSNFFTPILGVLYDESLAKTKDIRLMNKYLAEISGRDLSLFESGVILTSKSVSLKSFLKA